MADVAQRAAETPKSKAGSTEAGSPKSMKKPEKAETVLSNGVDNEEENEQTQTNREDEATETAEGVEETANGDGEEDDESEAIPVGAVDADGNGSYLPRYSQQVTMLSDMLVVDGEGKVVGHVSGSAPEGSMVDAEGDVMDTEGNIIGKADIEEEVKEVRGYLESNHLIIYLHCYHRAQNLLLKRVKRQLVV
jgi:hypothetical protein